MKLREHFEPGDIVINSNGNNLVLVLDDDKYALRLGSGYCPLMLEEDANWKEEGWTKVGSIINPIKEWEDANR